MRMREMSTQAGLEERTDTRETAKREQQKHSLVTEKD